MIMLKKLFGRGGSVSQRRENDGNQYASGTQLAYDSALISRFEGHDQALFKLVDAIEKSAENQSYDQLKKQLVTFRGALQEHLLEENLKLYVYLTRCLNHDPVNSQLVDGMKTEMNQIASKVVSFLNQFIEGHIGVDNIGKFSQEFERIKGVLSERIRREETSLYTLYLPPDSY